MMFHRRGARGFWVDRGKRILVPLVAGWPVIAPLLGVIWVWGPRKSFGDAPPTLPIQLPPPPAAAFQLTHLWFLYYLLILYALVTGVRTAAVALDRGGAIRRVVDTIVGRLVRSGAAALVLPLPLIAAFLALPTWFMSFGIPTPDQSLIPQLVSLVGYGTAIAFGWLAHRQLDLLHTWARLWPIHLGGAVAATVACLSILGTLVPLVPAEPGRSTVTYAVCYGVAVWCWSFAWIGLAVRFMSRANGAVRHIADASYWIYLVHLPLVVAGQVLIAHLPWHWSVKFPLILGVSIALMLASYHYLVRPTFIGQILNGRRHPRRPAGMDPLNDVSNGWSSSGRRST